MTPRFKIVCTSYKAHRWLPRCLKSIASQTYPHFDVAVADDASPGGREAAYVRNFCQAANELDAGQRTWTPITRRRNIDIVASQHECIEAICKNDNDVIVIVDGDDFLYGPRSLEILASHYEPWVQMTYGNYEPFPPSETCPPAIPFPPEIIENRSFRHFVKSGGPISFNHLRTYRYGLYRQINADTYLKNRGRWLCVDAAVMLSCLELAGKDHKVIEDKLIGYNSVNPNSCWRIKRNKLLMDDRYLLSLPPIRRR